MISVGRMNLALMDCLSVLVAVWAAAFPMRPGQVKSSCKESRFVVQRGCFEYLLVVFRDEKHDFSNGEGEVVWRRLTDWLQDWD